MSYVAADLQIPDHTLGGSIKVEASGINHQKEEVVGTRKPQISGKSK